MKCAIIIRSYRRDYEWCVYALRSIQKRCRGFTEVVVLVTSQDEPLFKRLELYRTADGAPVRVASYPGRPQRPMIECMVQLCYSDKFCPDADLILHDDSDCVFTRDVTPETYMHDGKPDMLVRTFESLRGQPPMCWKEPASKALGVDATHETMARHPGVFWRETYASMRDRVEAIHPEGFYQYATRFPNKFPWGFVEFPTIGLWAMLDHPDRYNIIDVSGVPEDEIGRRYKNTLHQGWTHFDLSTMNGRKLAAEQRMLFEAFLSR